MAGHLTVDFENAFDRLSYGKTNLPDDLKKRVAVIERRSEKSKEQIGEQQAERRDQDIADKSAQLRLSNATAEFRPPGPDGEAIRLTETEIGALAHDAVDRANAAELAAVDRLCDARIAGVIALGQARESEQAGDTPETPAADYYPDAGGDFYRAAEPSNGGPEL